MIHTAFRVALPLAAAILLVPPAVAGSDADPAGEEPEFGLLKEAPGVETTFYACTACHSERIIAQQGLTREEWGELIEWMVEEQGMVEPEEAELREILDYLATHYNVDRPNFPTRHSAPGGG